MPSISSPSWVNSVHFAHMHTLLSFTAPYLGAILHSYSWVPKESAPLYVSIRAWPWRIGQGATWGSQNRLWLKLPVCQSWTEWARWRTTPLSLSLSLSSTWRRRGGGWAARGWWEVTVDPVVFLRRSPQRRRLDLKGTAVSHCHCHGECHYHPKGKKATEHLIWI